ncbi:solute carrier family 23 member 1-like [Suricata suricatta]|uniref:solute carrier family 23 member 1-like n=1 Tax=Suricata suricatta TaxID=37032 RepID=UPI001155A3EC|nr:solute carrier family 23 member 1-like [Suricata suricatta]
MASATTSWEHSEATQREGYVLNSLNNGQDRKKGGRSRTATSNNLVYSILDVPPWYLCILLGIQHFLTALGGLVAVPLILAKDLCLQHDPLTQSYLISTIFFVSGLCTLLQVFFGVRGVHTFIMVCLQQGRPGKEVHAGSGRGSGPSGQRILESQRGEAHRHEVDMIAWPCNASPEEAEWSPLGHQAVYRGLSSPSLDAGCPFLTRSVAVLHCRGQASCSGPWKAAGKPRICLPEQLWLLQGTIMVASCVQILVGFSGLIGFLMRFIGPLTIAPTISLVALPLFDSAGDNAGIHWGIAAMTIFLIVLFSQYLKNVTMPLPVYGGDRKCHTSKLYLFQVFPVLLALCISWLLCFALTVTNTLPTAPTAYGHLARTDTKGNVLSQAPWFRFPYPGQWGLPTVSLAGVFGIIAGVISSMVESVGDYYACARLVGAPPPPRHAVNRGIGIEGLGCLLAGAWGTGNGTTSYSENIGALGITKVGSRMVMVAAGCVLLLMGVFGKIGAAFATIPTPVMGGMFLVMFGVITAVGISNLQYVDMNSSRNLFIFGFSISCGLAIPSWVNKNSEKLQTGILQLDQVIQVLLTTGMFVGGFLGFLLDNTIPGSLEERGLLVWNQIQEESEESVRALEVYCLPCGIGTTSCTSSCARRLPFWPRGEAHSLFTCLSQNSSGECPEGTTETDM